MATHIVLLRGVNVGGNNKVPMAALRTALTDAGMADVRTYIQSGNVVVDDPRRDAQVVADDIRTVIRREFDVDAAAIGRSTAAFAEALAADPFSAQDDDRKVHLVFLPAKADAATRATLDGLVAQARDRGSDDELTVGDAVLYLHTPGGFGVSELAKSLTTKGSGAHRAGTARNRRSARAILALARG